MPVLAVLVVLILILMIIYAFVSGGEKEVKFPKGGIAATVTIALLVLIIALLFITGYWSKVVDFFVSGEKARDVALNLIFVVIIIGAIVAVIKGGKGS
jgi:cytochrome c oxidase subunit IV